jgi:hypothetical protein
MPQTSVTSLKLASWFSIWDAAVWRKRWLSVRGRGDARPLQRVPHHPPDRAVRQRLKRRPAFEKDLAVVMLRLTALQVGD